MASGTVGYTDTRGNKDYLGIIANQVGKRLKQASDMAGQERAYAEGMAEAGGTSLSEAGIGKGYFFGRALGSRFGGDRIARTRGRMSSNPGPGRNPASNYKQRFRGGFDYKVSNNIITDTAPLSNAVATGLAGVQGGLVAVSNAIARQDSSISALATTQADMAKAIMFNGYLFQMFASNQKANSGRASARREESSIERRGGGRGGFGGGSGGGGRGMINVTPGGAMTRRGGRGGYGGNTSSFGVGDILNFAGGTAIGRKVLSGAIPTSIRRIGSALTGAPLSAVTSRTVLDALAGGKISKGLEQLIGAPVPIKAVRSLASSGAEAGVKGTLTVLDKAVKAGELSPNAMQRLVTAVRGSAGGNVNIMDELLDAQARLSRRAGPSVAFGLRSPSGQQMGLAQKMLNRGTTAERFKHLNAFKKMGGVTKKQAKILDSLGLSAGSFDDFGQLIPGTARSPIVDDILKYYPNVKFKNIEQAVALTQFGRFVESGMSPKQATKAVENLMGTQVAQKALGSAGEIAAKNTKVGKALASIAGKNSTLKMISKKIPLISAVAGTFFALQRAMEGDLYGAGLELASGALGFLPTGFGQGAGFAIDSYLLARDMGVVPMKTGAVYKNRRGIGNLVNKGNFVAQVGEGGIDEVTAPLDKGTMLKFGLGFFDAMERKSSDFIKHLGLGVFGGLAAANRGGLFSNLMPDFSGIKEFFGEGFSGMRESIGNFFSGLKPNFDGIVEGITNTFAGAMDWMKGIPEYFSGVTTSIGDFFSGVGSNLKNFFGGLMPDGDWKPLEGIKNFLGLNGEQENNTAFTMPEYDTSNLFTNIDSAEFSGIGDLSLPIGGAGSFVSPTIINNYYGSGEGTTESKDEVLGSSFSELGLDAFLLNYSFATK